MKAKSIRGKSSEEIRAALMNAWLNGYQPDTCLVFLFGKQEIASVTAVLDAAGTIRFMESAHFKR